MKPPPRIPQAWLRASLPTGSHGCSILGDLREEYEARAAAAPTTATLWYWWVATTMAIGYAATRLTQPGRTRPSRPTTGSVMEMFVRDLRHAVRRLWRSPSFALIAIGIMGLGIGANTAIFSIVNAVLFRPLPYDRPDELVRVFTNAPNSDDAGALSYPDFIDYRAQTDLFQDAVVSTAAILSLVKDDGTEAVFGEFLSADFFGVLGMTPSLGRGFLPEEDDPGLAAPVAMVSHAAWQRRYGGDPAVVGTTVRLNGAPVTVVGVGPEDFKGTMVGVTTEFWMPWGTTAAVSDQEAARMEMRNGRGLFMIARLQAGVTVDQARAGLNTLAVNLAAQYPETNADRTAVTVLPSNDVRLHPMIDGALYPAAALLMAVVVMVLLVACTNLANLLLLRASGRRKEVAVRLALGARRSRLVAQLLTESTLLGVMGGLVGLVLARWTAGLIVSFRPPLPVPIAIDVGIDGTVLAFTMLLSTGTGVLFGLAPALQASRPDVVSTLKDEVPALGGRRRFTLRNVLVVAQVAVSLILLVGAGLFVRSLGNSGRIDPGFESTQAALLTMDVGLGGYTDPVAGQAFYSRYMNRLASIPGVEHVALAERVPLGLSVSTTFVRLPEMELGPDENPPEIDVTIVTPEYFSAMDVAIVRGRGFSEADGETATPAAIVSEAMALRYWGHLHVLGEQIFFGRGPGGDPVTVIGVAADTKVRTLGEAPRPYVYSAFAQNYTRLMTVIARTAGDPEQLAQAMRAELVSLDANVPVFEAKPMAEHLGLILFAPRMGAILLTAFGLLALALASIGLYGVVAFSISQRTREVGIRVALGANTGQVLRMVLVEGLRLVVAGLVIGGAIAAVGMRPVAGMLVGVDTTDPLTFAGVAALLAGVAAVAAFVPARRAARVDPMVALRYE